LQADGLALSPDGKSLYTFGGADAGAAIRVFSRDAQTGRLTPVRGRGGCARIYWAPGKCFPMHLNQPTALAVSPDGRELFVTGHCCAHTFLAFRRDPVSGRLLGTVCCATDPRAAVTGDGLAVSPDGRNVYIASADLNGHGLAILDRDPQTGALTQPDGAAGCIQRIGANGCAVAPITSFAPETVVVSADGRSIYVLTQDGKLFVFARDNATGSLTAGSCFASLSLPPCLPFPVLNGEGDSATGLLVPADGRNVYVAGTYGPSASYATSIVAFTRQDSSTVVPLPGADGCLVPKEIPGVSCTVAPGLTPDSAILGISADAKTLYTVTYPAYGQSGLLTLGRDAVGDGGLRQAGKAMRLRGHAALDLAESPDGHSMYIAEGIALFVYRIG
jgi:DNA-binding beta-propeller fold protein YncE